MKPVSCIEKASRAKLNWTARRWVISGFAAAPRKNEKKKKTVDKKYVLVCCCVCNTVYYTTIHCSLMQYFLDDNPILVDK